MSRRHFITQIKNRLDKKNESRQNHIATVRQKMMRERNNEKNEEKEKQMREKAASRGDSMRCNVARTGERSQGNGGTLLQARVIGSMNVGAQWLLDQFKYLMCIL